MKTFQTRGFQATIDSISILDLLQHMVLQLATGRLAVMNNGVTGDVYFDGGRFVHSSVGHLVGQEALMELIRWPGGNCVFESGAEPTERTFPDLPGDRLLLDFLRVLDETGKEPTEGKEDGAGGPQPSRPLTEAERAAFAAARFCREVAELGGVVHVGVLTHDLSLVGRSHQSFEDDRTAFEMLLAAGARLSVAQNTPLEVIEAFDDIYNFFIVQLKDSFLCCRTSCTLGLKELLRHLRDLEGVRG